jgi:hypothetical protein
VPYFFRDPSLEFNVLIALGGAYHQAVDPGKLLWLTRQIKDGDDEDAFQALKAAGDEAMAIADGSASRGHRESARQAYAWAQTWYYVMGYVVDGSDDPGRAPAVYDLFNEAWLKGIAQAEPAPVEVSIPYEGTALRGFHFRGNGKGAVYDLFNEAWLEGIAQAEPAAAGAAPAPCAEPPPPAAAITLPSASAEPTPARRVTTVIRPPPGWIRRKRKAPVSRGLRSPVLAGDEPALDRQLHRR